jgi:hypothetical protein
MVSYTDYPNRSRLHDDDEYLTEQPRRRRFRLFAALAAPFRDMDDRALHKKYGRDDVRNNSKGNMFTPQAATPVRVPVRRFPRGDD